MSKVLITGEDLTVEEIVAVCRQEALVELSDEAKENVRASRKIVDDLIAEEKVVYGITTGFGKFSDVVISQDQCKELQKNLIITHAVGAGEPFPGILREGSCCFASTTFPRDFPASAWKRFRLWWTC